MSDNSNSNGSGNAPQMGQAVNDPRQAAQIAADNLQGKIAGTPAQSNSDDIPQEQLEKMSGAELKEYFERKKAKEEQSKGQPKPRQPDGKFAPKEQSNTPNPIKEAAKAAEEAVKKYKVKVDGQELEVDEAELLRGYSHQRAASKKLQEGLTARKQAEQFINMMRDQSTLMDTLKKLGHDPRQLAEQYLAQQLQEEMMDPRERELKEAKRKLQAWEDMERKQKEEVQRRHHEQMKQKFAQEYQSKFIEALQQTDLPPTKHMVGEMARYIGRAAKLGYELTPAEAAKLVRDDVQAAHRRLIGDTDGEMLLKLLGEDVANKIRKYDVEKIKTPQQVLKTIPKEEQGEPFEHQRNSGKRMTPKEWQMHKRGLKK